MRGDNLHGHAPGEACRRGVRASMGCSFMRSTQARMLARGCWKWGRLSSSMSAILLRTRSKCERCVSCSAGSPRLRCRIMMVSSGAAQVRPSWRLCHAHTMMNIHVPEDATRSGSGSDMCGMPTAVHRPKLGHWSTAITSGAHRFPVVEGPADDVLLEEGYLAYELVQLPLTNPVQHGRQLCSLSLCMERDPRGCDGIVRPSCRRPRQDAELVWRVRVLCGRPASVLQVTVRRTALSSRQSWR